MADTQFLPREAFAPHGRAYALLPFRFERWGESERLLVSDAGEFAWLADKDFDALVEHRLERFSPRYAELQAKHFLVDAASAPLFDTLASKVRTKRSFLDGFTKLHIFVTTLRCNQSCQYCQVSRRNEGAGAFDMTEDILRRSIDLMLAGPAPHVTMEFQGGEPLLNFDLLVEALTYAKARNADRGKRMDFVVCTNLSLLEDSHLAFFKEHDVQVSSSLDGPAKLHDRNRPLAGGPSHATVTRNIARAQEALGRHAVSCLMTTSRESLKYPREIVDEYLRMGMGSIFLRDLNPYGYAVKARHAVGYTTEEFLRFYKEALAYIVDINRGGRTFSEAYTALILTKVLTPWPIGFVDLQSPSGAGMGVVLYNYDGEVYASDESRMLAEMGKPEFRLGNVLEDDFAGIFFGQTMQMIASAACNEALAGCSDCALQPYCGADPVRNFSTQGDILGHRPSSGFCRKHMGAIRHVLGLLRNADEDLERIFWAWVGHEDVERMRLPQAEWLSS